MNTVLLQNWKSLIGSEYVESGCSLHIDTNDRNNYVLDMYKTQPHDRVFGNTLEVCVSDNIYHLVNNINGLRLEQYEMNNLLKLEEIIYNTEDVI